MSVDRLTKFRPTDAGADRYRIGRRRLGKMTMVGNILAALALVTIVLGFSQIVGPRCGKYLITDDTIEFVICGNLRVWRSSFEDISDIQLVSFARAFILPALHLMNRPFAQYVLVRRRRGMFRWVLITPEQPQELVRRIQEKIRPGTTG
jgi:hypothetical protein